MAKKEPVKRKYLLDDSIFERVPTTGLLKDEEMRARILKWPGHAICACPFEAHTAIDYTGQPGSTTGLYYALTFQLPKWEYFIQKADEWIEVSPVHAQYYQLTQQQKSELEAKIKAGLTSTSQAIADMELLMHDLRKYKEFLHYLGYRTKRQVDSMKKKKVFPKEISDDYDEMYLDDPDAEKRADNHSLRAVFIDQVDAHTGEAMALRSIVQRWPTLISDFMRLEDKDMDVEAVRKKLDVSRAEAVVLVTKNKLFAEWKNLFAPEIKSRYARIRELVRSREESVKQYREWLKPVIARHKMINEGLSDAGRRASMLTHFIPSAGTATSSARITIWTWKDFRPVEIYKGGYDEFSTLFAEKRISPYDKWTKNNLIFGREWGLINKYPWITETWVLEKMNDFFNKGWLSKNTPYYSFFILNFDRTNIRMPTGAETEDGIFDLNLVVMSQNVLLTKLLELAAKQEELNKYVDELIGIKYNIPGKRVDVEEKNYLGNMNKFLNKNLFFGMQFWKSGPYEKDFFDRLTNVYYAALVGIRYQQIVKYVKQKIGMPT
jgi:hypothetical protein